MYVEPANWHSARRTTEHASVPVQHAPVGCTQAVVAHDVPFPWYTPPTHCPNVPNVHDPLGLQHAPDTGGHGLGVQLTPIPRYAVWQAVGAAAQHVPESVQHAPVCAQLLAPAHSTMIAPTTHRTARLFEPRPRDRRPAGAPSDNRDGMTEPTISQLPRRTPGVPQRRFPIGTWSVSDCSLEHKVNFTTPLVLPNKPLSPLRRGVRRESPA